MNGNVIVDKSLAFAVRIVRLYRLLRHDRQESVMSKQLLRCGTSIGANVAESQEAQTSPDFVSKLYIALKECSETRYWLKLLSMTDYLTDSEYKSIDDDASELHAMLITIIKTKKSNMRKEATRINS